MSELRYSQLHRLLTGKGLRATLLRGGVGSFLTKGLQAIIALLLTIVLARVLGPEQFGIYSFVLAALMLVAIPTQVGAPQLLIRETAKYAVSEDWPRIHGLWRWSNRLVLSLSLAALLMLAVVLWFTGSQTDSATLHTAIAGSALIPLIALANLRAASLRGLKQVVIGQLPEKIIRPAVLLLFVLGATQLSAIGPTTAKSAMTMHSLAALIAFISGWALISANPTAQVVSRQHPISESQVWRRAILPLSIISGFQLINSHVDTVILGLFRESEEVGVYRAVSQLSIALLFALNALQMVIQPYLSGLYATGDHAKMQKLITISANTLLVVSIIIATPLLLFPAGLLGLFFGSEYRVGAIVLQILSIGLLFKSVLGPGATILTMTGQENLTMKITGAAALVNVALNLCLIPWLGMLGAAISTALTFSVWSLWLQYECKKTLQLGITPFFQPK